MIESFQSFHTCQKVMSHRWMTCERGRWSSGSNEWVWMSHVTLYIEGVMSHWWINFKIWTWQVIFWFIWMSMDESRHAIRVRRSCHTREWHMKVVGHLLVHITEYDRMMSHWSYEGSMSLLWINSKHMNMSGDFLVRINYFVSVISRMYGGEVTHMTDVWTW